MNIHQISVFLENRTGQLAEITRLLADKGIDLRAIMRAAVGVLTKDSAGGGSTLTQQLIKNNIFSGGNEDSFGKLLELKIQELYLAVQLEKTMDKKIILKNYLNTINLGNNTLGVKAAAKRYFDKSVSDLTLSEATVIAGITQNPSKYNPISENGQKHNEENRKSTERSPVRRSGRQRRSWFYTDKRGWACIGPNFWIFRDCR